VYFVFALPDGAADACNSPEIIEMLDAILASRQGHQPSGGTDEQCGFPEMIRASAMDSLADSPSTGSGRFALLSVLGRGDEKPASVALLRRAGQAYSRKEISM
jgi:hypothetical protein